MRHGIWPSLLVLALWLVGWFLRRRVGTTTDHPRMAQLCPDCNQKVQPVVTCDDSADEDDPEEWLDEEAGLHCPHCGHRFGAADSVDVWRGDR